MEFSLDSFDIPETYKAQLLERQRRVELVNQINPHNYKEIHQKLIPLFPQLPQQVMSFCELFIVVSKTKSHVLYYSMWVLCQLLQTLPQNSRPLPQDVLDSSTEIFSYFVKFGIFSPADYRQNFEDICTRGQSSVISSLIIVSSVFDKQDILNFYLAFDSKPTTDYYLTNWGTMGSLRSTNPTALLDESREEEDKPELSKINNFLDLAADNFKEVSSILECKCKTNNILAALLNDDIDWFIKHCNSENPVLGNHKYEFLNRYYGIEATSQVNLIAAMFNSPKILSYLISRGKSDHKLIQLAIIVAINGDLENLKLIASKIQLPSDVLLYSLPTTSIPCLEFLTENCLGMRILFSTHDLMLDQKYTYPPLSMAYIVQKMNLSINFFQCWISESSLEDLFSLYLLHHGAVSIAHSDLHTIIDFLLNRDRDDVIKAFLERSNLERLWIRLVTRLEPPNDIRLIQIVKEIMGEIPMKSLITIFGQAMQIGSESLVRALVTCGGNDFLEEIVTTTGLTVLNMIAFGSDPGIISTIIRRGGADINNTKHPELAAPVHFAATKDDPAMINALLSFPGLDLNRYDGYNRTPLDIAQNPRVAQVIYNNGGRHGTKPRLDLYNERDFIRSNLLMKTSTALGPLSKFSDLVNSQRYESQSKAALLVNNFGNQKFSNLPSSDCMFATRTIPIIRGPYRFGDLSVDVGNVMKMNFDQRLHYGGYGTIGGRKVNHRD